MFILEEVLEKAAVEAVIVADPYNMRYIAKFEKGEGFLYLSKNRKVIVTDARYTQAATDKMPEGFSVSTISNGKGHFDIIRELASEDGITAAGFEDLYVTYADYKHLEKKTGIAKLVALGSLLQDARVIKTEEEINCLRIAESIGDKAFTHILGYLKPGLTELQVAAELEHAMKLNGAEGLSFDSIIASGYNSALPHAIPSEKVIEEGDFLTMDFGCIYKGYCSDMTRTVVIGKASDRQKEVYNTVLKAQLESLKAVKAGVVGSDVHKVAADIIDAAGFGEYFGHGLGHSVGLEIHENPRFSPKEDAVIRANTIETVEPGIYIPGFGGVRIEDMILVTEDGHENFAHSPKELIEII